MKLLYVLLFLYLSRSVAEKYVKSIMMADIIQSTSRPSAIISMLCWSSSEKKKFYHSLAVDNITQISMTQIREFDQTQKFYNQSHYLVFLVDMDCPDTAKYLELGNLHNLFRSPYRWFIISGSNIETKSIIPQAILHMDVFPESDIAIVHHNDNGSYDVYFIYRIGLESAWRTELYGSWNMSQRFQKTNSYSEPTSLRRLDLDGVEIKICYVLTDNDSMNHLTDEVNDHIDTITKVNFPTTNHLLDFLNAKRKYIFANTWGYLVNGSWNGMTGYLVREEVEIGGSPMFFTAERVSVIDYISSPTPTRSKFVFQQPKLSYENNLFLLSFRTTVWYSTIALVSLIFLVLLGVAVWEWKKMGESKSKNADAGILRPNVVDVVILIFGATCQQGSPVELKGSLGRVVMLILFLTLMFLYTSYAANIVALLQSSSSQIRTIDDLFHSRIKFGVHDTVFNRYYFSTASEPIRKAIYEKKVAPPGVKPRFMTMEEGVRKMQKGLFAFHMETGVGYKFVGKYFEEGEKCGLKEIQYLQVIDPWLAVRKNTPYKEMFKIGMKRIIEHGLQNRENLLLYEKRPKCSGRESNFVSVSMVDCYPALLVLSYGTLLALILLISEKLWYKRQAIRRTMHFSVDNPMTSRNNLRKMQTWTLFTK